MKLFEIVSKKPARAKKPVRDHSPLGQLKELPQPIGVNGGSYTYWVDVTKTPLKWVASDGSEMDGVSTLEGIKPWLEKHTAEFWQEFLDGEESLEFMLEERVIRLKKGRTDQQEHEAGMREGQAVPKLSTLWKYSDEFSPEVNDRARARAEREIESMKAQNKKGC